MGLTHGSASVIAEANSVVPIADLNLDDIDG